MSNVFAFVNWISSTKRLCSLLCCIHFSSICSPILSNLLSSHCHCINGAPPLHPAEEEQWHLGGGTKSCFFQAPKCLGKVPSFTGSHSQLQNQSVEAAKSLAHFSPGTRTADPALSWSSLELIQSPVAFQKPSGSIRRQLNNTSGILRKNQKTSNGAGRRGGGRHHPGPLPPPEQW